MPMILVAAVRLWCSLGVQSAGLRIEVMRFGLLLVLTVALLSVAFRIHSHSSSSSARPSTRPTPVVSPTQTAPANVLPTASTRPPASPRHPRVARTPGTAGAGTGAGGSTQQILPVTGWGATVKLGGIAFILIGGGAVTVCLAGPRQRPDTVQD
jgi:hypothetical protein